MKFTVFLLATAFSLMALPPKTDVILETTDGILLHSEYISETEKSAVVDVRSAIFPARFCEEKDFPPYIPKGRFKNAAKFATGECRFIGNPFLMRSLSLERSIIRKRLDTTLLVLPKTGEKKQMPFADASGKLAWGYTLAEVPKPLQNEPPRVGLTPFAFDKSVDTIQTVDISGIRTTLYPRENIFHKWSKFDPRVGLLYSPLLPTADISLLKFGVVGFTVENSIAIPDFKFLEALKRNSFRLRGGLLAGFHHFSQDLFQNGVATSTGSITLIPVLLQLAIYWDWKPKNINLLVSPYFRFADGLIFSSVTTSVKAEYLPLLAPGAESSRSGSYVGNGLLIAAGFELKPSNWPVAFILDGGYMLHSQDIMGQYFMFNAGAAWHYGVTLPEAKTIPLTYLGPKSVSMTLKGLVKAPDGKVLSASQIILRVKGSTAVQKETTVDAKGAYSLDLEPGLDYEVEARKDAYAKAVLDLPLATNDKRTREHDFILAPLTYSLEGVNFKPDSDELIKGSDKSLLELVKFLSANKEVRIEIGGHTAASGADDANSRALSKKRAESVRKFIIAKGIEEKRLTAEGYGGSKPIADGKTAAGAAKNRRVEVRVLVD